jgi:3D (Asp-Asp-Asp) domain-containing protein
MLISVAAMAALSIAVPVKSAYATSYCLSGTMANGKQVHKRAIAHNFLRPGTRIRLVGRSFYGRRKFIVSDTGPALRDGHFDIWSESCSKSMHWGSRPIKYKIGWGRPR